MMTSTYHLDLDALTVIRTDERGEERDLNATGEPCATRAELVDFIRELRGERFIDDSVESGLLASLTGEESEDQRWVALHSEVLQ